MAAVAYPDSSFLVSIYRQDGNYPAAHAYMARYSPVLAFGPLHRLEVRNALRFAEKQRVITVEERRTAFAQMEEDLRDGFLVHLPISWSDGFRRADELSDQHASQQGQRTIDLLHVALAVESGIPLFLTFDRRQRTLAHAAGLKVGP